MIMKLWDLFTYFLRYIHIAYYVSATFGLTIMLILGVSFL